MAPIDPDETQPMGILADIPEEEPTSPEIPLAIDAARELRCFACAGHARVVVVTERYPGGEVRHAVVRSCRTCRGQGTVSARAWREFHATRAGRPGG